MNSPFTNRQLFVTPVGVAMTNSPIESYSKEIKESFTKRVKHHLKSSLKVFQELINYESIHSKSFEDEIILLNRSTLLKKFILLASMN